MTASDGPAAGTSDVATDEVAADSHVEWFVWDAGCIDARTLSEDLPRIAHIKDLGYGELESGDQVTVEQALLLYTSRCSSKAIASNVYWNESRAQYVSIGPKLAVPVNSKSWFLLLTDNRIECADTWNSVLELARAQPTWAICHETLHVYRFLRQTPDTKDNVYRGKMIKAGQVFSVGELVKYSMTYCGDSNSWVGRRRRNSVKVNPMSCACGHQQNKSASQFLQCATADGQEVLLPTSGPPISFSRVGDLNVIDTRCVYQLADVARREQKPFIAKLVLGEPPDAPNCHFTGLLRVESVKYNECLIGCMIEQSDKPILIEVPIESDVVFVLAVNSSELLRTENMRSFLDYCEYNIDYCQRQMKVVHDFYPDATPASIVSPRTMKARCLPPLPTAVNTTIDAGQDEAIIHHISGTNAELDDQIEVEVASTCAGDSLYETIPHAYCNRVFTTDDLELNNSQTQALPECGEDEDGYLVPVNRQPVAGCSNEAADRSTDNADKSVTFSSQIDAESVSSERLNAFLADSIEQLDRLNVSTRLSYPSTPTRKSVSSCGSDAIPVMTSKESVGAYLDRIFGCDDTSVVDVKPSSSESEAGDDDDNYDDFDDDFEDDEAFAVEPPYCKRIPVYTDDKLDSDDGYARVTDPYSFSLDLIKTSSSDQYHTASSQEWSLGRASSRFDSGVDTSTYSTLSECGLYARRLEVESPYRSISDTVPYAHTITSWTPPETVTSLTVDEVEKSMRHIGMREQVVRSFSEAALDGKQLSELTEDLLLAGFPEFNSFERKKIVDFANGWRPKIA